MVVEKRLDLPYDRDTFWYSFVEGTCTGMFGDSCGDIDVYMIHNTKKGNGAFQRALDWFYDKCRTEGKTLTFTHVYNDRLLEHLIKRQGFKPVGKTSATKKF